MNDFGPWIRPTVAGPFLTTFGLVTLAHLVGGDASAFWLADHQFDSWLVSMVLTGFVTAGLVVSLIVADVVLLAMKSRKLPSGLGAWMSSMLAPFALWLGWHLVGAPSESVLEGVLRFVIPFPASALVIRWALGRRP